MTVSSADRLREIRDTLPQWKRDLNDVAHFCAGTPMFERYHAIARALDDLLGEVSRLDAELQQEREQIEQIRVAMRNAGPHYYLIEDAARRARKGGREETAERLEYVHGRMYWMDFRLGTMQERVKADEVKRLAALKSAHPSSSE